MKKIISSVLVLSLIFLTSCSNIEIVELNERLIIEAIGIDYADGLYKVTIEGLDSFTAGTESNSISAPSLTKCFLFEGETIGMAMNSISVVTGQLPLFSQARILILGFNAASEALSEILDFFRREYTTRTDILFAVAKNTAAEVVAADFGKNVSSGSILQAAIMSYKHTGRNTYTPLYRFINSVLGDTDSPCCPVINIKKNAYNDSREVELTGTAVFGKDKSAVIISPERTLGLMLITGEIRNGDITVRADKGTATIEIIDSKTKIRTEIKDGRAHFTLKLRIRCDIPEFQSEHFRGLSKSDTENIARYSAKKVSGIITDTLDEVFYKNNYDAFGIGRRINLENHGFYAEILNNNIKLSDVVSFDIDTEIEIRRIGKIILAEE
ncbi:MAG: Ger(x)C family spore germination protein [Clostridia bacterium]|nr:Ger(x)C family spore germination protein [Clostridia bacterium]